MNTQETIDQLTQRIEELEREIFILTTRVNILHRLYNYRLNDKEYIYNNITCITEIDSPIEVSPSINRSNIRTENEYPEDTSIPRRSPRQTIFQEIDVEVPTLFGGRSLSTEEQDRFLDPIMATQRSQLLSAMDSYLDEKKRQDSFDDTALFEKKRKK